MIEIGFDDGRATRKQLNEMGMASQERAYLDPEYNYSFNENGERWDFKPVCPECSNELEPETLVLTRDWQTIEGCEFCKILDEPEQGGEWVAAEEIFEF